MPELGRVALCAAACRHALRFIVGMVVVLRDQGDGRPAARVGGYTFGF
jgi:hypothetical protein